MKPITIFLIFASLLYSQVTWEKLNPPPRAEVDELLSLNDTIILAGTQKGSVFRSEDSGLTWNAIVYGNSYYGNIGTRYLLETNEGGVLASIYDSTTRALYSSADNGLTWSYLSDEGGEYATALSSGEIFQTNGAHLQRSDDNGLTWERVDIFEPPNFLQVEHLSSFDQELYILGYRGLYYSSDIGETWTEIDSARFHDTHLFTLFAKSADTLIVQSFNSFYFSTNAGAEWQTLNNGINVEILGHVKFYSHNYLIYMATRLGLYYFDELTWSWQIYNAALEGTTIKSVEFVSDKILCGTAQNMYRLDRTSINESGTGMMESFPRKILFNNSGDLYYNTEIGFFKRKAFSKEWSQLDPDIFCYGASNFTVNDSMIVAQGCESIYYASEDEGETWVEKGFFNGIAIGMVAANQGNRILICRSQLFSSNFVDEYWYTDNFGESWVQGPYYNNDLRNIGSEMVITNGDRIFTTFSDLQSNDLGVFHYSATNMNFSQLNVELTDYSNIKLGVDNFENVLAGNSQGLLYNNLSINSWHPLKEDFTAIKDIQFSSDNQLAVVNGKSLWLLVENDIWENIGHQIPAGVELCYFDSENYLYAANPYGELYVSQQPFSFNPAPRIPQPVSPENNAKIVDSTVVFKWNRSYPYVMYYQLELSKTTEFENPEIFQVFSDSLEYVNPDSSIDYFWRIKSINLAGESEFSEVRSFSFAGPLVLNITQVSEFKLEQNYPNPFNPKTRIVYQLKKDSMVSLEVIDIKGERVELLTEEFQRMGEHSVTFDGSKLSSGVYLYRLQVSDENGKIIYTQGNKMLLLK